MRKLATGLMSLSLFGLLSAGALADHNKDLKENITINNTVYVNGVKVKPGRYKVRYDGTTHEMKLERGSDVVVTAKASIVMNTDKFEQDALLTRGSEDSMQLTGIRLGGQREEIQLDAVTTSVTPVSDESFDETADIWYEEFFE